MQTIVRQVEAWYAERRVSLGKVTLRLGLDSRDPDSPGGEVGIGIETANILATILIWNTGLIDIPAVAKASGREFVYDHRELAPDEDLVELLDRYLQQIATDPG